MAELLVKNDTGRKLQLTLQDDGAAVNLTGATANLHYRIAGGTVKTVAMTLTDAVNGVAEYQFATGDLDVAGSLDYEVQVTDSGGKITTFKESGQKIRVADELA